MSIKVVDASALVAILFDEEDGENLALRLRNVQLAAPTLLPYELANVCINKMRKAPTLSDGLIEALRSFPKFGIELHEIEPDEVVDLAARRRLSAYDASYLWLARRLGAELVTLDRRLLAASLA